MGPIAICLWFDDQAEEAAKFYTSVFKSSKILETTRYPEAGHEIHGKRAGSVLTVTFEINGQRIIGLNGGPQFKFTEAASLSVDAANFIVSSARVPSLYARMAATKYCA